MLTFSDPLEDIFVGVSTENDPQNIVDIVSEILGYEFIETGIEYFDEVGTFSKDTLVIKFGLVDDDLFSVLKDNDINILIAA